MMSFEGLVLRFRVVIVLMDYCSNGTVLMFSVTL